MNLHITAEDAQAQLYTEAPKTAPKKFGSGGVDLGDDFELKKMGNDINGNYSYWVYGPGKKDRLTKIQRHAASAVTDWDELAKPTSSTTKSAIKEIKDYYNSHVKPGVDKKREKRTAAFRADTKAKM